MDDKILTKEPTSEAVIRFQDCDPFGHLNNARYIDYFINAREDHLLEHYNLDIYERQKQSDTNWVVTKTQIAYIYPVFFREKVSIRTSLIRFSDDSLLMEGVMSDQTEKYLKSVIWIQFRYFSLTTGKVIRHSDELMKLFAEISIGGVNSDDFDARVKEIVRTKRDRTF